MSLARHLPTVARILMGPYNRRRCSPPWPESEIEDLRSIAQSVARTPIQAWGFMLSRDRTGIEVARDVPKKGETVSAFLRRAGTIINRASQNLDILAVTEKAANDYVSEVDRTAEEAIIRVLLEAYPAHSVLAEESGASGKSEFQWIIDPLDGTTNYLHGFPQYAVSIEKP